jgi:hypothetical protein
MRTTECEDVNICTSAKAEVAIGGNQHLPFQSQQTITTSFKSGTKNQAPKGYTLVSTTDISTTESAHITGTS